MQVMAFDKGSVRTYDQFGHLHVSVCNLTKENVREYRGKELKGWRELGLEPDRLYAMYCPGDELEKAIPTFNGLRLLDTHRPVTAENHDPDLVVGAVGTSAAFRSPYVQNKIVVWDAVAIELIENDECKELSAGYLFDPDMTPGTFKGLRYDGVMRNIVANHIALVSKGRAGSDVMVGDSSMKYSRLASLLSAATLGLITPRLAEGMTFDAAPLFDGVTPRNIAARKTKIAAAVVKLATPLMAQDGELDVADVIQVIEAVQGSGVAAATDDMPGEPADTPKPVANDSGTVDKMMKYLKGKLKAEDLEELMKIAGMSEDDDDDKGDDDDDDDKGDDDGDDKGKKAFGKDEDGDDDKKPVMDAALIRRQATRDVMACVDAERLCEPLIGRLEKLPPDPSTIYAMALAAAEIEYDGVPKSGLKALVIAALKMRENAPVVTMDSSERIRSDDIRKTVEKFPGLGRFAGVR